MTQEGNAQWYKLNGLTSVEEMERNMVNANDQRSTQRKKKV